MAAVEASIYDELPQYKVASIQKPHIIRIDGENSNSTYLSTQSISTYPLLPGGERDGDPIADRLYVQLNPNRAFIAVADGCNWGPRPHRAAKDAIEAVSRYMADKEAHITDVHDAGHFLLRSFSEAHKRIVADKEDIWEAGTTTLLSALALRIHQEKADDPEWGVLCASVGDCKGFLANIRTKQVVDITTGNRNNVIDGRDPGGRLGPYVGSGFPDLRNLKLYFAPCQENDILIIVSDGVHDNLDPCTTGKVPADLALNEASWDAFPLPVLAKIKSSYMRDRLSDLLFHDGGDGDLSPAAITDRIIQHCKSVTSKSRDFMENNPNKRQPTDYIEFPGKMDHTTCVTLVIGHHQL
eukprot:TRINITY_DN3407_c0_g1_i1.p1 TRINITY_DN3407_c0_g1~~TRINITY_DN3407_c0_g1_i1.p1  ORF type:complete len:354 (+),score=93.88 TRINITY_DN3407_c0_g1_i1:108-1169(+)